MGMGEPLQNLDAVLEACDDIAAPQGLALSPRRIAISTVGWVPGIARLAEHPLPVRLAISLHAADDRTRGALMPINARYPIASLMAAARRYCDRTGRRVFIEYLLLDGVNDAPGRRAPPGRAAARRALPRERHRVQPHRRRLPRQPAPAPRGLPARPWPARAWRPRCAARAAPTSPPRAASSPAPAERQTAQALNAWKYSSSSGIWPGWSVSDTPCTSPALSMTKVARPLVPGPSR